MKKKEYKIFKDLGNGFGLSIPPGLEPPASAIIVPLPEKKAAPPPPKKAPLSTKGTSKK